jgi:CheY-like chemotaxis protein
MGAVMENRSSIIRGLINDLMHSLTAALVHVDDLIMKIDKNSENFSDAWLTNEQLGRSIELFLELRLASYYFDEHLLNKSNSFLINSQQSVINFYKHKLNEVITAILGSCDLLLDDRNNGDIENKVSIIHNSINKYLELINNIDDSKPKFDKKLKNIKKLNSIIPIKYDGKLIPIKNKVKNKILLVEDDDEVRKVTAMALVNDGYILLECENGKSALNVFAQENAKIDLCIIDLGLPDMNGDQLGIKLLSYNENLNIIFTSGQDETYLHEHYDINGRFDLLKKPYRFANLINKVERAILS